MKIKSMVIACLLAITTTSYAQEKGEQLFMEKCSICHAMQIPKDRSAMSGPPARGIMFHMNEAFGSKEKIQAHIEDFVMNPTMEKAICNSVRRFGLMPSQKGLITEEELKLVSTWMVENLYMSEEEHNQMQRRNHK